VRSVTLHGGETWRLRESEMAMVRAKRGVKRMDRKKNLMEMLLGWRIGWSGRRRRMECGGTDTC